MLSEDPIGNHSAPVASFSMQEIIIRDFRSPGRPLQAMPVKIPADRIAAIQSRADRMGCSRGSLARSLLLQGLEQLEQAAAQEVA